jgi:hypothetical protein
VNPQGAYFHWLVKIHGAYNACVKAIRLSKNLPVKSVTTMVIFFNPRCVNSKPTLKKVNLALLTSTLKLRAADYLNNTHQGSTTYFEAFMAVSRGANSQRSCHEAPEPNLSHHHVIQNHLDVPVPYFAKPVAISSPRLIFLPLSTFGLDI